MKCFKRIKAPGQGSDRFLELGIETFIDACRFVHELPYGYNSDRDDLMILFKERFGTCSTKHAGIATLAVELHIEQVIAAISAKDEYLLYRKGLKDSIDSKS